MKDDRNGLKDVMLFQIAPSTIEEDINDLAEMVKGYNQTSAILDVPEDPDWEANFKEFATTHHVEQKTLNNEVNALNILFYFSKKRKCFTNITYGLAKSHRPILGF